jgi:hypothetical protein
MRPTLNRGIAKKRDILPWNADVRRQETDGTMGTLATRAGRVIICSYLALTASCMRTVQMNDPALKPFASMYSVDRAQYGFTPLPNSGPVSIEGKSSHGGYGTGTRAGFPGKQPVVRPVCH